MISAPIERTVSQSVSVSVSTDKLSLWLNEYMGNILSGASPLLLIYEVGKIRSNAAAEDGLSTSLACPAVVRTAAAETT